MTSSYALAQVEWLTVVKGRMIYIDRKWDIGRKLVDDWRIYWLTDSVYPLSTYLALSLLSAGSDVEDIKFSLQFLGTDVTVIKHCTAQDSTGWVVLPPVPSPMMQKQIWIKVSLCRPLCMLCTAPWIRNSQKSWLLSKHSYLTTPGPTHLSHDNHTTTLATPTCGVWCVSRTTSLFSFSHPPPAPQWWHSATILADPH